mgnify:CR=1 FL=1
MPKVRKEIPELEKLVQVGRKKFVRYEEGAQLYSMGLHTFQELAKDAKAVYHVKRVVPWKKMVVSVGTNHCALLD